MTANEQVRTVVDALGEVARSADDERVRFGSEMEDVAKEMASLEEAISNLQEQHGALVRLREELEVKTLGGAETGLYYDAIFSALGGQASALAVRAEQVQSARAAQEAALAAAMNTPEIASLKAEAEQFKTTIEPTLEGLPDSYREVLLSHHRGIEAKLEEHMSSIHVDVVEVDTAPLTLSLVFAVDVSDGEPEVLTVVFPIYEDVYSNWETRTEDISTRLASALVQGLYQACREAGLGETEGMFGGHQELLAMEVDLAGSSMTIADLVVSCVHSTLSENPEFLSANIEVEVVGVDMDHLLPAEEEEEEEEDAVEA
jgi:hypothetical protein